MKTDQMTPGAIAQAYNNLPKQARTLPVRDTHDILERVEGVPEEGISREIHKTLNEMLAVLESHE